MMKVKDPSHGQDKLLPRIAQEVRRSRIGWLRRRLLAEIASLQAEAGDFAGARQTADSIPDIKRADFPGPSDGFLRCDQTGPFWR